MDLIFMLILKAVGNRLWHIGCDISIALHKLSHCIEMSKTENKVQRRVPEEKDCGCCCIKPAFLQTCNNPKGFLFVFCIFSVAAGSISGGLLNINVSALERRFRLSSAQSALIVIGYDIGFCVLSIIVTYFGGHSHRPRIIACGAASFGLGCLIYVLPHFTTPLYDFGGSRLTLFCLHPNFQTDCSGEDVSYNVGILFVGALFMGFGLMPLLTLGLSYIEDSVSKNVASVYLGVANAAGLAGPMIGFLGGGVLLRDYFVDFDKLGNAVSAPGLFNTTQRLTYTDPRWVGAWWLIPTVMMVVCWLVVIPIMAFPKQLPGTARNRARRVSEVAKYGGTKVAAREGFGKTIRDFPRALWTLLKNPTFLVVTIAGCLQALLINGISAFMTKYIENAYHQPLGDAAVLTGSVIVPAGVVGNIVGGLVVYKFKWKLPGMLRFCAFCMFFVAILSPGFLLYCDNRPVAGITTQYRPKSGGVLSVRNLTTSCNSNCNPKCQKEFYAASCGIYGIEYFSPCHAGCYPNPSVSFPQFTPCACVNTTGTTEPALTLRRCTTDCNRLGIALFIAFLQTLSTFSSFTPALLVTFRCVPDKMRSFGIGVQVIFFRLLGSIPGPLLYGAFIDKTCIMWQTRQCDNSQGSCWIYNNRNMALSFMAITITGNGLSAIFYFLASFVYKPASTSSVGNESGKVDENSDNNKTGTLPGGTENPAFTSY